MYQKIKSIDSIQQDFSIIDTWQDRYRYIIDLGEELEEFPQSLQIESNKIQGCMSQVWIATHIGPEKDPILTFRGTSDSHIVRGLIFIVFSIFSHHTASTILTINAKEILSGLELDEHITLQRSNGLYAMIENIKTTAKNAMKQ